MVVSLMGPNNETFKNTFIVYDPTKKYINKRTFFQIKETLRKANRKKVRKKIEAVEEEQSVQRTHETEIKKK